MGKSRNCKTNCKMYCQPSLNETFSFKIKFTLLTDPSWVFPLHCNTSSHCQGPLIWQQFSTLPADTQSSTPLIVLCFLELWELWPNNRCTQPGTIDRGFYLFIHTFFQIVSTACIRFPFQLLYCWKTGPMHIHGRNFSPQAGIFMWHRTDWKHVCHGWLTHSYYRSVLSQKHFLSQTVLPVWSRGFSGRNRCPRNENGM